MASRVAIRAKRKEIIQSLSPGLFVEDVCKKLGAPVDIARVWCHKFHYILKDGRIRSGRRNSKREDARRRRILANGAARYLSLSAVARKIRGIGGERVRQLYKSFEIPRERGRRPGVKALRINLRQFKHSVRQGLTRQELARRHRISVTTVVRVCTRNDLELFPTRWIKRQRALAHLHKLLPVKVNAQRAR